MRLRHDLVRMRNVGQPEGVEHNIEFQVRERQRFGIAFHEAHVGIGLLCQPDLHRGEIETGRLGYRGGTGIDTFGPDLGTDENYLVSLAVYQRHRISLEILANLAALPTTGAHILCGGHINKDGAGSTALIYGVIPPDC